MSTKIVMEREAVDRLILVGMDADRYQTQVIPDLQQRVEALTRALTDLVEAVETAQQNPALAGHVEGASARARQALEAVPQTKVGQS